METFLLFGAVMLIVAWLVIRSAMHDMKNDY